MLGIVTCFFNPCGYQRTRDNYSRFRAALNRELVTVELSFNGKFEIPDAIHLRGNPENLMWQKERLLNIGIEYLPKNCRHIAWIDTDLIFLNRHWAEEAETKLETVKAVQLCERIHHTDDTGRLAFSRETFAKGFREQRLKEQWFHTGGAWAARREVLEDESSHTGLFDRDIIGGADAFMAFAWSGDVERAVMHAKNGFNEKTRLFYRKQAERLRRQVEGQIDYVPGEAIHLWHGDREKRQYVKRLDYLKQDDFSPETDIAIDRNGLWKWNSDKPGMHRDVANYFALRDEDGTNPDVEPTGRKRKHVTWGAVGVTTAPRQKPTLERSLKSLAEAGFEDVRLFAEPDTPIPARFSHYPLSQRDQKLGAFPNWYLALTEMYMRDPHREAYMLCQDDVIYTKGVREYLESGLWPDANTGVVSLYCPSHDHVTEKRGFYSVDNGWNSWGALAYVFPNPVVRKLLTDTKALLHRQAGQLKGLMNIDSVVGAFCREHRLGYFVHTPSLAQHIGATSTLWKSKTLHQKRKAHRFHREISEFEPSPSKPEPTSRSTANINRQETFRTHSKEKS